VGRDRGRGGGRLDALLDERAPLAAGGAPPEPPREVGAAGLADVGGLLLVRLHARHPPSSRPWRARCSERDAEDETERLRVLEARRVGLTEHLEAREREEDAVLDEHVEPVEELGAVLAL